MSWYKLYKESMPMVMEDQISSDYQFSVFQHGASVVFKVEEKNTGEEIAFVELEKIDEDVWHVKYASSNVEGYGPTLYDMAMKFVTNRGDYMISNQQAAKIYGIRGETSDEAKAVWEYYRKKRPDVVETEKGFKFLESPGEINPNYIKNDLSDVDMAYRIKKDKQDKMNQLINAIDTGDVYSMNVGEIDLLDHEYSNLSKRIDNAFQSQKIDLDTLTTMELVLERLKNS
jgi:hypothetical protein